MQTISTLFNLKLSSIKSKRRHSIEKHFFLNAPVRLWNGGLNVLKRRVAMVKNDVIVIFIIAANVILQIY